MSMDANIATRVEALERQISTVSAAIPEAAWSERRALVAYRTRLYRRLAMLMEAERPPMGVPSSAKAARAELAQSQAVH